MLEFGWKELKFKGGSFSSPTLVLDGGGGVEFKYGRWVWLGFYGGGENEG